MCPRKVTPIVQQAPSPGTLQVLTPLSVPLSSSPGGPAAYSFYCLELFTSPLPPCPAGNILGCNLSCPRAPSHRPPCTNSLAPAATRLTPESQHEGRGLAVDTPVIFHIAIQLPGTLAPGPSSTTTWQSHRTAGSDGCCPSAHPTHPAADCQPLLCQPQDHRQPAPSSCQARGPRPKVSSSQHPKGQGRLPAWPLRSYTALSVFPALLQGLTVGSSMWLSHTPSVTFPQPHCGKEESSQNQRQS